MREVPAWYLTEAEARQFYEAVGLADLADEGIHRLTGPAAAEYSWTAYLLRDNARGGIEEMLDGVHYALFDILRLRALERLSADEAELAGLELVAAAKAAALALRHFQNAQRLLKS